MKNIKSTNFHNIYILGITSFITDTSSEIILSILPMFLISLGATGIIIGLVGGLMESVASIFKIFSGKFSDKIRKRLPFVFCGYFMSFISKIFLYFSTTWLYALVLLSIERIGKGIRTPPRDALIAESSYNTSGKGFGIHRAMDTSGAIVGVILAFVFVYYLALNFQTIILIAGIIAFFALIPLIFVKERKKDKKESKNLNINLNFSNFPKKFKLFLLIAIIFAFGNFTYMFFLLKAQQYFSGVDAIAMPILLYVIFNIFYALFSFPAGILADKFGKTKILMFGYILFSSVCFAFAFFVNSLFLLIFAFIFYGISYAFIDGIQRALVSDIIQENLKGTGFGIFHFSISIAALLGGIVAGFLWQIDSNLTFIFGWIATLISAIILFYFNHKFQ